MGLQAVLSLLRRNSGCCLKLVHKQIVCPIRILSTSEFSGRNKASRVGFDDYENETSTYKLTLPKKFNFASDVLDVWAHKEKIGERNSSIPAFWFVYESGKEVKWTYQELQRETKKTANFLQQNCGIGRGDNIIVMLPKIPEFWLVNAAAIRIGCCLSPCSMMLTAKDLSYRFRTFQPTCIVAHDSVIGTVEEALSSNSDVKCKVVVSNTSIDRKNDWQDFKSLHENSSADHQCADTEGDESMLVVFTSGTTGHPKMVEHSQANYSLGMQAMSRYGYDTSSQNIGWVLSDTGWAKIYYATLGLWSSGSCLFVHEMLRFSAKCTLQVLNDYPIDTFCAPPLAFRNMVQEDLSKYSFPNLEHCVSGGEALNSEVAKSWLRGTGLRIYQLYGQTETVALIGMFKCIDYKLDRMGKPVPGMDIKIIDENENELGPGQLGEIAVKRSQQPILGLLKGFKGDPELTRQRLTEKYFHTGDVAYYDTEGYFWFVGRKDDVINSAGYRIGPFEVESALLEHPAVLEAAVVSSPCPQRGEVVKAFIVLTDSFSEKPELELTEELQNHVKKVTAPYKYPRKIEFARSLPKTVSGKIMKHVLKRKEWN